MPNSSLSLLITLLNDTSKQVKYSTALNVENYTERMSYGTCFDEITTEIIFNP